MSVAVDVSYSSVVVEGLSPTDQPRRTRQDFLTKGGSPSERPSFSEKAKPGSFDHSTLTETIRRAQLGDSAAFEAIYKLYCGRVYALCLRMVRETGEAEDLTQEAFMQLFRKIHTFRGESAFSSWLHRLTANVVLMHFRKKKLLSTSLEDVNATDEENAGHHCDFSAPDVRLTGLFDRVDLQTAFARLPQGYKAMFLLHDVQGYDHREIAEILGCSIGTSKSQLHRARIRLRALLHKSQGRAVSQRLEGPARAFAIASCDVNRNSKEAA